MGVNFTSLRERIAIIDEQFNDCPDLIKRKVYLNKSHEAYFIYFEGLVDSNTVQQDFISPILLMKVQELTKEENFLSLPLKIRFCRDCDSLITAILSGGVVFMSDRLEYGIVADFGFMDRKDNLQPQGETFTYGLPESFQEQLSTNLASLRRKIKSSRLKFRILEIGATIKEKIAIAYLEGVAAPVLLEEIDQRFQAISNEDRHDVSQIELALKDFCHSPFPQYQCAKQLDLAVAALFEGRLAVLRDGNPVVILTPTNFFTFFHAWDDRHTHWCLASGMRLLRIAAITAVIFLPGIYIALSSFHYQFLNLDVLIFLAQSRARVPLLPIIEVLFMELILAVFYELGSRHSSHTGVLVGIIGGLLIGGALLTTGVISSVLVIISALSLMASFLIPIYHIETIRLLRCLVILFAGLFGMLGVAISASLTFSHLIVLSSLGQPYLQPFIPFRFKEAMASIVKVPRQYLRKKSN